jgi:glutamine cyclotransferase
VTRQAWIAAGLAALVLVAVLAGVGIVVLTAEDEEQPVAERVTTPTASVPDDCAASEPEELTVDVVRTIPHDAGAYTQGLVMDDGRLFESTGREGASTVRELDPRSGEVLRSSALPDDVFGEGLAMTADDRLVQLTWLDGRAYAWDPDSLERTAEFPLDGEGWGLTTLDDGTLVSSDGSDQLTLRDPDDLTPTETVPIERVGGPTDDLNELEWDGQALWANRYRSDELIRIDLDCGTVTGVADLSQLREDAEAIAAADRTPIDVTNGVAHEVGTDRYLVTGKWWPTMYEVRIS